jgi:hypothetical protein
VHLEPAASREENPGPVAIMTAVTNFGSIQDRGKLPSYFIEPDNNYLAFASLGLLVVSPSPGTVLR